MGFEFECSFHLAADGLKCNSFISSYFLAQHPYVFHQEFNSEHR